MSDAIKAALREAAWAECEARAQVNECETKRCPRRAPCEWCANGAAAAVAAFLNIMREVEKKNLAIFRAQKIAGVASDCVATLLWLKETVEAVERAALEADDG